MCDDVWGMSSCTFDASLNLMAMHAQRHTPETWAIMYQADARARLEHLERLRRRAWTTDASGFKQYQPWEWCMRQVFDGAAL